MITQNLKKKIREDYKDFECFFKKIDQLIDKKIQWIYTTEFDYEKNHEQYICNYFISSKGDLLYISRKIQNILKPFVLDDYDILKIFFKRRIDFDIVELETNDINLYPFPYSPDFIIQYLDVILTKKFSEKHTR
jgi:hypothetical protein